jgi:hypothetical protein
VPERRRTGERRRQVEVALGVLWLLDGALQFQPYMFSRAFMAGILGMANMGLPGPLSTADFHVAEVLSRGNVVWNAIFATLQVAIGVGLIWGRGRSVTWARGVSVIWALGVWTIGEGVGALFMGGTSLLSGAPGAALLYAVIAVVIWPPRIRAGAGRVAWAVVWVGSALLELQGTNHAASVPGAQIANGANGEPGLVAAFDRAVGHALAGQGGAVAAALGLVAVFVGLGVLFDRTRTAALVTGIGVALFVGLSAQNLGGILTGQGTDPGVGPLLILLAVTLWPVSARGRAAGPAREEREQVEAEPETEHFGFRDGDLDPGAATVAPGADGGRHAALSRRQLPVGAVADPDQHRAGRRRRHHHPGSVVGDEAGGSGDDTRAPVDLVEPPVR